MIWPWRRSSPWPWHRLAHVFRKWRHVISISPCRLGLWILCKFGAPIGNILRSRPTLSIAVRFNTSRKTKLIPRNIMIAFRRPDRLREISLYMPSSIIGPIVEVIQKPCQALESIRISVNDATGPSILVRNAFLGGSATRLREIKLDRISFPFRYRLRTRIA
jgi:hypothetical protein